MSITKLRLKIDAFLSEVCDQTKNDRLNICACIYRMLIEQPDDAPEALRYFFENSERIESANSRTADGNISESTGKELKKQYAELVDALFEQQLSKNLPISVFYQKIWEVISVSPCFDDENARIFALYYIWIDARIPYFQLDDGISMSNKEFQEYSEQMLTDIQKARFILRSKFFEQRTSRASVLLGLIESQKSDKEKAVLLSHILSFALPSPNNSNALREILSKLLDDTVV